MSGAVNGAGRGRNVSLASSASGGMPAVETPAAAPEAKVQRGSSPSAIMPKAPAARDPRLDALVQQLRTEPAAKLAKTLDVAQKTDPTLYRAAVREVLTGTHEGASKLKLHLIAMDSNNDGKLKFGESYKTMHDMGFHPVRAFLLSGLTSLVLAPMTNEKFSTTLDIASSDKTNRSFFNNAFDEPEKLEAKVDEVMAFDADKDGKLTQADIDRMVDARVAKMDSKLGAKVISYLNKSEWQALLKMTGGTITRDELKDFYTGPLFFSFLEPDNLAKKIVAFRKA